MKPTGWLLSARLPCVLRLSHGTASPFAWTQQRGAQLDSCGLAFLPLVEPHEAGHDLRRVLLHRRNRVRVLVQGERHG